MNEKRSTRGSTLSGVARGIKTPLKERMKTLLPALILVILAGCQTAQLSPSPEPSASPQAQQPQASKCETIVTLEKTVQYGALELPRIGTFVVESHLASTSDSFSGGRLFPNSGTENIAAHLAAHDPVLRAIGRTSAGTYTASYERDWTPPEGGKAGQGAVGDTRPSIEEETWVVNMNWLSGSKPKAGTKYLMSYQGKNVVVVAGYEIGPGGTRWIGGAQPAVFHVLGAEDDSLITIGKLKDQSLKPGPVNCNGA